MKHTGDITKRLAELEKKARERKKIKDATARKPSKKEKPITKTAQCYDISTKDNRSIMDVAVFRLSKKDKRAGQIIRYKMPDGYVQVSSGPEGMASIWDYDIVLMAISRLTEAMNKYRRGEGKKPGRVFRPRASEILKFCQRPAGGRQKDDLIDALIRLAATRIDMERARKMPNGETLVISEGEPLIGRYRVMSRGKSGKVEVVEIEIPQWIYEEVVEAENPDVLTVHPDFFLIEQGIARFLYRLARRSAGKGEAKWLFKTIYERSGSAGSLKEFSRKLRRLINTNNLPEYTLTEMDGKIGAMLLMKYRSV